LGFGRALKRKLRPWQVVEDAAYTPSM